MNDAPVGQLENHVDDANFLHGITAYGHIDGDGSPLTMSLKCNYFESVESLKKEEMKTIKFWLYREDAIVFAEAIIKSAKMKNAGSDELG